MSSLRSSRGLALLLVAALVGALVTMNLFGSNQSASAGPGIALTGATAVEAGAENSCVITPKGVKCSGMDFGGAPAGVAGLSGNVTSIAVGFGHMCALLSTGSVSCWGMGYGLNAVQVSGIPADVTQISSGGSYNCVLTGAGAVSCWGKNAYGQLSDGSMTSGILSLDTGFRHACAVTEAGAAICWGHNDEGQLGDGTNLDSAAPVAVAGLSSGIVAVAAGSEHSCALTDAGAVRCWGLGFGPTPVAVVGLESGIVAISSLHTHTCALTDASGVKCWGSNLVGQLGDGLFCGIVCPNPVDVVGLQSGVAAVSAGANHSCALLQSGGVKCWGLNTWNQLGDGTVVNRFTPVDMIEAASKFATATPSATPTPCPATCPTATPTRTPTPTSTPCPGCALDFSIGVDVNGNGVDDCSTRTGPTVCSIPAGGQFTVKTRLNSLPLGVPNYDGFDVIISYTGVSSKNNGSPSAWPSCAFPAASFQTGFFAIGCSIGINAPSSTYLGTIVTAGFACGPGGTVSLHHGSGNTDLLSNSTNYYEALSGSETLTIFCLGAAGDADGDGCSNAAEQSADPTQGGGRDPLNPWDYFNPTGDGLNRIDDILTVVEQYFVDIPDPSYSASTDRYFLGPDPWDTGPPTGQQRIDDILNALHQYYHDCP